MSQFADKPVLSALEGGTRRDDELATANPQQALHADPVADGEPVLAPGGRFAPAMRPTPRWCGAVSDARPWA